MAGISASANIKAILKIVYKDGVQSLLFRNSPLLRALGKTRIEGKEFRFAAVYGRGGATGGDYTFVRAQAIETARNVEWKTIPGQMFSALTINQKEIMASRSRRGAYMTVLGNKTFAALEGMRKQLAVALYGTGYGEFAFGLPETTLVVGSNSVTLDEQQVIGVDVGTTFRAVEPNTSSGSLGSGATVMPSINVITALDGARITFTATAADEWDETTVLVFEGSRDAEGNPLLPIGLEGWLPTNANRSGAGWTGFIANPFYGVNRSVATDRLAGQFVLSPAAGSYKIADVITELFRRCRRAGAEVDMIVLNDKKFAELMAEMETQRNYWQAITGPGKGDKPEAVNGLSAIMYAFSTSWIGKTVDDPYCPYNKAYCLETKNLELVTYSNVEPVTSDGIAENEPGKAAPESEEGRDYTAQGCRINIDDIVTIEPGVATAEGPSQCVSFNIYGTFTLYNTGNAGVAVLQ